MDYEFLRNGLDDQVEFQKHCTVFLERMRHGSSFELVQRVKSFVNHFYGTQGSADEYSQQIHHFIEDVSLTIRDHPLWKDEGEDGIKWAVEAMEKYLLNKLYKVTYYLPNSTDDEDDEKFHTRVRTLQFLQLKHLDIPDRPLNKIAVELAAEELVLADNEKMKCPLEKLTCILNSITVITNLLKHYAQEKGTGADDLLPYIIYTVLLLSPKHMHSNLRFIKRFRRESEMKSEAAYYFTQMESAIMFIMELDHRNLSISKEEFETGLRESEELIQSGLDISRFNVSPKPRRPRLSSLSSVADATSPMVARRATVIQEWNRLQRTHSLSSRPVGSKERGEERKQADRTEKLAAWTTPSHDYGHTQQLGSPVSPDNTEKTQVLAAGGTQMQEGQSIDKVTDKSVASLVGKRDLAKRVLSARFEEMTVSELKQIFNDYQSLIRKQGPLDPVS